MLERIVCKCGWATEPYQYPGPGWPAAYAESSRHWHEVHPERSGITDMWTEYMTEQTKTA